VRGSRQADSGREGRSLAGFLLFEFPPRRSVNVVGYLVTAHSDRGRKSLRGSSIYPLICWGGAPAVRRRTLFSDGRDWNGSFLFARVAFAYDELPRGRWGARTFVQRFVIRPLYLTGPRKGCRIGLNSRRRRGPAPKGAWADAGSRFALGALPISMFFLTLGLGPRRSTPGLGCEPPGTFFRVGKANAQTLTGGGMLGLKSLGGARQTATIADDFDDARSRFPGWTRDGKARSAIALETIMVARTAAQTLGFRGTQPGDCKK